MESRRPEPSERRSSSGADFLQLSKADAPARGLTTWLVEAVRDGISTGRASPGSLLPPSRSLAEDLGISRGVVVEAYQRLREEGLVDGRSRSGTRVLATAPDGSSSRASPSALVPKGAQPQAITDVPYSLPRTWGAEAGIDLSPGVPDLDAFPRGAWLRAERAALSRAGMAELGYGDPQGSLRLRTELAGWLTRTRGLRAGPGDIMIVSGVAQALALLARVLVTQGTTAIAVEDPGSRGARDELAYWGLAPVPVAVDADGLVVEDLAAGSLKVALVTPAHHFPTGVVMTPQRRRELLLWASQGHLVIEDDYDAEFRYDRSPVPAMQASAPDAVAYTGSVSKALAPGARLGWLIAPEDLRDDLVAAKHASDLGSPAIPQMTVAHLISSGDLDRHVRSVRNRQRLRRDALLAGLRRHVPQAVVAGIAAGLHLLVTLPSLVGICSDVELAEKLRAGGVFVHPLTWHRCQPGPPGLVLGYAASTPGQLGQAAEQMGSTLSALL